MCLDVIANIVGQSELADVITDALDVSLASSSSPSADKRTMGLTFKGFESGPVLSVDDIGVKSAVRLLLLTLWTMHSRDEASVWFSLCDGGWLANIVPSLGNVASFVNRQQSISSASSPVAVEGSTQSPRASAKPNAFNFANLGGDEFDEGTQILEKLKGYVIHYAARSIGRCSLLGRSNVATSKALQAVSLTSLLDMSMGAPGSVVWSLSRYLRVNDLADENKGSFRKLKGVLSALGIQPVGDITSINNLAPPSFTSASEGQVAPSITGVMGVLDC